MNRFLLFLLSVGVVNAFYSIKYFGVEDCGKIVNKIENSPTLEESQVADIYTRLSGLAPLIRDDELNLPTFDVFTTAPQNLLIAEVISNVPIENTCEVVKSEFYGPKMDSVLSFLNTNKVNTKGISFDLRGKTSAEITDFLTAQNKPVLILQHDEEVNKVLNRALLNANVTALEEYEISQYQIALWSAVGFVLLVLTAVCAVANMEVIPDSLLYAKFQSGRTGKME